MLTARLFFSFCMHASPRDRPGPALRLPVPDRFIPAGLFSFSFVRTGMALPDSAIPGQLHSPTRQRTPPGPHTTPTHHPPRTPHHTHSRPEPFKYIHFPTPASVGLTIAPAADGASLTLSVRRPAKGVVLDVAGAEDAHFADQALDLVPDDPQTVAVRGLAGRPVVARFLGDGSA